MQITKLGTYRFVSTGTIWHEYRVNDIVTVRFDDETYYARVVEVFTDGNIKLERMDCVSGIYETTGQMIDPS